MINIKLIMLLFIVLNAPHPLDQAPASARDEAEQYMKQKREADRLVEVSMDERTRKTRFKVPELGG